MLRQYVVMLRHAVLFKQKADEIDSTRPVSLEQTTAWRHNLGHTTPYSTLTTSREKIRKK